MNRSNISLNKNSFVITANQSRFDRLCRVFLKNNINIPRKIDSVISNNHALGCKLSHIKAIRLAKKLKLPYCIIFEDDAYPCINCEEKFNSIVSRLQLNDIRWDILNIGIYGEHSCYTGNIIYGNSDMNLQYDKFKSSKNIDFINKDVIQIHKHPHGSVSYVIRESAYETFILNMIKHITTPVDFLLGSDNFRNHVVLTTKNMLFIQYFEVNGKMKAHYPFFYNIEQIQLGPIHWMSDELPIGFI